MIDLDRPLSHMQGLCVALLVKGKTPREIAKELSVELRTIRGHLHSAARKVPGDLPPQVRLVVWARGATLEVLTGAHLPAEFRTYAPTDRRERVTSWQRVVFSADCDEDGNCPVCGIPYEDCPCPGPTMDEYEYRERDGILEARPRPQ